MNVVEFDLVKHIDTRTNRYKRSNIRSNSFPGLATIELNISELCNRTCSFCPRFDPKVYPNQKQFMDLKIVRSLVKQIDNSDWNGNVHLSGFGEPHSHPELLDIVKILGKSSKVYLELTTNGDRLVDKDINELVDCLNNGLDIVNVDCYDNEEQYQNRKLILDSVNARYTLRKYFDTGMADAVLNYGFTNRGGTMGEVASTGTCHLPFYKTMIDWNGNVILCCSDWHREAGSFGNILKYPLTDIWNGSIIKKIRESLLDSQRVGVCSKCSMNGTKVGKPSLKLWRKSYEAK